MRVLIFTRGEHTALKLIILSIQIKIHGKKYIVHKYGITFSHYFVELNLYTYLIESK